ncbi:MAG TPA: peptidylprolyl isomerase [Flavobacteriales bacterium]|nr:peptidylprolyl isomerase [Flavobacteriales bacterium]HIO67123.1 peptidylprolyl isomerase [Flavobacteriales bacterium]
MKKNTTILMLALFAMCTLAGTDLFAQKNKQKEKTVEIITEMGIIKVKLYNETPLHRDNFLKLVESGEMNSSTFHRVIKGFMVQGGGKPGTNGEESIGETIPSEILPQYYHKKGALAAARMGDKVNPKRNSSGSQFYIVHGRITPESTLRQMSQRRKITYTEQQIKDYATIGGTPHLDGQYTVFGEVVEGLDIVDKIASVQVNRTVPVQNITITLKVSK